jgi:hypothetical protein
MSPRLTICIPTNGIPEWVFPVLDSIYNESAAHKHVEEFEVVVTDNGENTEFKESMKEYAALHSNLNYQQTNSYMFNNQLDAFRLAKGNLIKFINHRSKLLPGSLQYLLNVEEKYRKDKPILNFANGNMNKELIECDNFDSFVRELGIWSTWSGGISMWRDDFQQIPKNIELDQFFPHFAILFAFRNRNNYIIDNKILTKEIQADVTKKGTYNLFEAFSNRFPHIMLDMVRSHDLSLDTFLYIKKNSMCFCANLYVDYVIRKHPCSYSLKDNEKNLAVFYEKREFMNTVISVMAQRIFRKCDNNIKKLHMER